MSWLNCNGKPSTPVPLLLMWGLLAKKKESKGPFGGSMCHVTLCVQAVKCTELLKSQWVFWVTGVDKMRTIIFAKVSSSWRLFYCCCYPYSCEFDFWVVGNLGWAHATLYKLGLFLTVCWKLRSIKELKIIGYCGGRRAAVLPEELEALAVHEVEKWWIGGGCVGCLAAGSA